MIGLPSLRALDGAQVARIWLAAEATDMRCGFDRFRGTAPGTAPEAVGPTAGPVARAASDVEGATAAQASHGRGNQLCPWPVGGTERVLLRWRSPHRQERQRARDQARGAQSQELLFVGNPRGGRTAAILTSLTSTCRRHAVDPQLYLTQLLTNLSQMRRSELANWLPDQWKRLQAARLRSLHNPDTTTA